MRKLFLLLLILGIILCAILPLAIIIYQHTPNYQYKVKKYIEEKEFEEMKMMLGEVSKRIKAHEKAVRGE